MKKNQILVSILFIMVLVVSACNQQQGEGKISPDIIENPNTANGEPKGDVPVFSFETTNHHFGEIKEGEVVNFTFNFKNTGTKDLFIISAKASCGCTIPAYSKEAVKPGDSGKIDVSFDSKGKSGMVSKTISVVANTIPNTKVLTISAEIVK